MKDIRWLSLTLSGFGRFRETVRVEWDPQINICIADNEQGKSTITAGLVSVLYGLPGSADAAGFGRARFRNWDSPSRFEGELELTAGTDRYRIRRNFDSNRVSLQKLVNGRWQEEAGGEHKPGARRRNTRYEEKLAELTGITSRELFTAVFFVAQPLPEGKQLIPEIQQLLSGGGAHCYKALETLAEELKQMTRYTARRRVSVKDLRQDRQLEQIDSRIAVLRRELEAGRQAAEQYQVLWYKLEELRAQGYEREEAERSKEQLLSAWKDWRLIRDRYDEAVSRQSGLTATLFRVKELLASINCKANLLTQEYTACIGFPRDAEEELAQLVRLEEDLLSLSADASSLRSEIAETAGRITALEAQLGDMDALRNRPALLSDFRELRKWLVRKQDTLDKLAAMERKAAELRCALDGSPYGYLGESPLYTVKKAAATALQLRADWDSYRQREAKQAERIRFLSEAYPEFEAADSDLLSLFAGYEAMRARYRAELANAEAERKNALRSVEEWQAARKQFQERYGELEGLGENAGSFIAKKIALLEEKRLAEDSIRTRSAAKVARYPLKAAVSLLLAAGSGIALYFLTGRLFPALVAAGATLAAGAAVFAALGAAAGKRDARGILGGINMAIRQIDLELGVFANLKEAQLGGLQARLTERDREARRLEELAKAQPDEEKMALLKQSLESIRQQYLLFCEKTADAAKRHSDLAGAFRIWQEKQMEVRQEQTFLNEFIKNQTGREPGSHYLSTPAGTLPAPWPELLALAALKRQTVETLGDSLSWLEKADSGWWSVQEREAEEFESRRDELGRVSEGIRNLRKALEDAHTEIDILRRAVAPFTEDTSLDELEAMVCSCREAEENKAVAAATLNALKKQEEDLAAKIRSLKEYVLALREGLSPLLTGVSTGEALRHWQEAARIRRTQAEEIKEMDGLLSAHGTVTPDELERKVADAANTAAMLLIQWDSLYNTFPALPPRDESDPSVLHEAYRRLENELDTLRRERSSAELAIRETEAAYTRLEGQSPPNVAVLELELRELQEQRNRLQREADALEIAYHSMAEAIEQYSRSSRMELEKKASAYVSMITGNSHRRVSLDGRFHVRVSEDGRQVVPEQLSQGARDQLYLAMRLAVADLLAGNARLPFVLDDPFVNWDEERLERMKQNLSKVQSDRQLILFSHRRSFTGWGVSCRMHEKKEGDS